MELAKFMSKMLIKIRWQYVTQYKNGTIQGLALVPVYVINKKLNTVIKWFQLDKILNLLHVSIFLFISGVIGLFSYFSSN